MAIIDKKTLEHTAELARIELDGREEGKILKDLEKILEYFEELKEVNVGGVLPMNPVRDREGSQRPSVSNGMNGGTSQTNVFREDMAERTDDTGKGKEQFPDVEKGFLKTPAVFEDSGKGSK